jgi:hypothetical protein
VLFYSLSKANADGELTRQEFLVMMHTFANEQTSQLER